MQGWGKIKAASAYAGVSSRTMRTWIKQDLRHARLPSGTILIKYEAIDEFISKYEEQQNVAELIVAELEKELS
jgi:predicted site-specific integrase-resolvase